MAATDGPVSEFAPAKINLTLHVTGQRPDGYHLLDSLVAFADIGDTIEATPSQALSLMTEGPEGAGLAKEPDNLVLQAARYLDAGRGAAMRLVKHLPVASGIGGGSADAAAALRALARLWNCPLPDAAETLAIGADVPVCLDPVPRRMSGTGGILASVPALPDIDLVLVNPRVRVSTPAVFGALKNKRNAPMPDDLPGWTDHRDFIAWLKSQRNDLQPPAMAGAPIISEVLAALDSAGCHFARMSGSGATCFGLFPPDGQSAAAAAARISAEHTDWWCKKTRFL